MKRRVGLALASIVLLASASASAQMSDNEKKAAARAAYTEGVEYQDKGKFAEALADFEKAEKLYDAPTHLLHIAQCQAQLQKLVEASETYETLSHKTLEKGAPDAFKQAQDQGNKDLEALKPRIPTLRVSIKPDPSTLQDLKINLNDKQMPTEMVGIARPINPGTYKITASAKDYGTKDPALLEIKEKDAKSIDLTLEKGVVVAGAAGTAGSDTVVKPAPVDETGPTPTGLLIGVRPLGFMPFGKVDAKTSFKDFAGIGAGGAIEVIGRVVKNFLVGGTIQGGIMSGPDHYTPPNTDPALATALKADVNATTEYVGVIAGYMLDVDHVTPLAFINGGYRFIQRSVTVHLPANIDKNLDDSVSGIEGGLHAGVSIPAGPMRIVPLVNFDGGQFAARDCVTADKLGGAAPTGAALNNCTAPDGGIFFMAGVSVGVYYHLDFGRPKAASSQKIKSLTHFAF